MTLHEIGPEYVTEQDGILFLHSSCRDCRLPIVAKGGTVRQAKERSWRALRDHRGMAYAAGPGRGVAA